MDHKRKRDALQLKSKILVGMLPMLVAGGYLWHGGLHCAFPLFEGYLTDTLVGGGPLNIHLHPETIAPQQLARELSFEEAQLERFYTLRWLVETLPWGNAGLMEVLTNTVAYYLRRAGYHFTRLPHLIYHEPPVIGFCVFSLLSYWLLIKSVIEQSQLIDGWATLELIMLTHEQTLLRHGFCPMRLCANESERETPFDAEQDLTAELRPASAPLLAWVAGTHPLAQANSVPVPAAPENPPADPVNPAAAPVNPSRTSTLACDSVSHPSLVAVGGEPAHAFFLGLQAPTACASPPLTPQSMNLLVTRAARL
jgi:hypothetical protein